MYESKDVRQHRFLRFGLASLLKQTLFSQSLQRSLFAAGLCAYALTGCVGEEGSELVGETAEELKQNPKSDVKSSQAEIKLLKAEIKEIKAAIKKLRDAFKREKVKKGKESRRAEIRALKDKIKALRAKIKALRNGEVDPTDDVEEDEGEVDVDPVPEEQYIIEELPTVVQPGEALNVTWVAPATHSEFDWVGLFPVGAEVEDYYDWSYVPLGVGGTITLTLPPDATGEWEIRYFSYNGTSILAFESTAFTVVVQ